MNAVHSQEVDGRILRGAWGLPAPAVRGPRPRYGVDDIAETAVALADAGGLGAVTLAAVAAELGLTTTALYRYVDSKETLVELMVDAALGDAPGPADCDWPAGVHAWVHALWSRYRAHPWVAEVQVAGLPRLPRRLAWLETLLLRLDGGPVQDPMHTALLLDGVTRAFALLARPATAPPPPPWLTDELRTRFPRLARELDRDLGDIDHDLAAAVDTVLRGSR